MGQRWRFPPSSKKLRRESGTGNVGNWFKYFSRETGLSRTTGRRLGETLASASSLAAINDYEHYRFHGYYNNVNAWTGTAAATFLAISQPPSKLDLPIRAFEQTAWLDSLKGIETSGPNQGLIPSELTRGKNSLAYSLFYYNAILVHREARRSLGISDTREDWTALRSFATRFGVIYCNSAAQFFEAAGSPLTIAEEATVKANLATYAFRISSSLMEGTLKGDMFNRCQAEPVSSGYIETRFGGDSRYIKAALRK